jgi:hypothetical protein
MYQVENESYMSPIMTEKQIYKIWRTKARETEAETPNRGLLSVAYEYRIDKNECINRNTESCSRLSHGRNINLTYFSAKRHNGANSELQAPMPSVRARHLSRLKSWKDLLYSKGCDI